jgi:dTDP-4-amino-4,6-dideoxygalactose transaminase
MSQVIFEELPAIEGGKPVRETFLPFGAPLIGEEEIAEVVEVLRSGWIGTGPKVARFEAEFAGYVGARFAVSVNSCTAGLFLSLKVLNIGAGDEVILPPLTFGATANVVEHVGARPVFVDIDPVTLNLDPALLPSAINERTKAIIPVHFGGLACDLEPIAEVAAEHNLAIVEDAAHALGTRYHGRMIGAVGTLTGFSFYANKNLTTAEGGMVTTDDAYLAKLLQIYRLHGLGRDAWQRFSTRKLILPDVLLPGYKFNMPDLAAALGLAQLRKQERWLAIREEYARYYDQAFADLAVRRQPRPCNLSEPDSDRHALHIYALILKPGAFRVHRNDIINALLAENIGAALHYRSLHTHTFYRHKYGYRPLDYPNAFEVGEHILSLPLTPAMSMSDLDDVVLAVRRVLSFYAIQ